jgi:hypothetical protein
MRLRQLLSSWTRPLARMADTPPQGPPRRARLRLEPLEERTLLTSFTPLQIRHAYGFDRVGFEDSTHPLVAGNGQGQTIALIDAFDDPNIATDLARFDTQYGIAAPPTFTKVNQTGGTTYPPANRGWATEIALDVEYAHAMAPGANILLVEATDNSLNNLNTAVQYAASHGATAVSMSYGSGEFSGETSFDGVFTHAGVTYLSSTGDNGAPGGYQAYSPNVVAVGGTSLFLNLNGSYLRESGWSGSGGGISRFENQPAYQNGVVTQSTTRRTIPDLAFDADPNTGVIIDDTFGGSGFFTVGGTSASSPITAGLAAVVNQGRSYLLGRPSYNGTDFLNALYHLPQSDLTDILTGNNGFAAGPGYDLVTGRGTPIVDRFVSAMIGAPVYNPLTGALLVTGGGRGSNDTLTLSQSGSQLAVQVSADTPVAGSDIPADQTFTFDSDQYSAVTLATGDGTTTVNVDDSADNADLSNVTLSGSSLTGLPLGPINFGTGGVSVLSITAGNGNDTWTISGTPADQGTTLNTGGGVDTVNVQGTTFPLTINSASGSGADTITLGDAAGTLAGITAPVTVNAAATDALVLSDQGSAAARTYTVSPTTVDWGGPAVTYSGLGSLTVNGSAGGDTFDLSAGTSATASVTLTGGSGANALLGSNAGNLWALTGPDTGTLSGAAYATPASFSGVGSLTAGSGGDTFRFADGATLSGSLTGGGADTLDYSAYSTSVVVDLQTGQATGVGGAVSGIGTIDGGTGNGALGAYNLLIGNGGNVLTGGLGRRNLLVAGGGGSTLNAGDQEDLLIGGTTVYDTEAGLVSWQQIAAYWAGTDDYATRVANLTGGSGVPLLDATTVAGNGGGNTLNGNGALALIYTDGLDNLAGFDPTSLTVAIAP